LTSPISLKLVQPGTAQIPPLAQVRRCIQDGEQFMGSRCIETAKASRSAVGTFYYALPWTYVIARRR
jgi:hypothetical protein